jgi:hypothetical protein
MFKTLKKRLFGRSCRQVSRLISDMQERPLGWRDRLALRFHLSICDTCVRYEKQVKFLHQAMGRWKNYSDDA